MQKQLFKGVLMKGVLRNMQQIYRRIPMLMCDFSKLPTALLKPHLSMCVLP